VGTAAACGSDSWGGLRIASDAIRSPLAKVYLGLRAAHLASAQATDRWVTLALAAYAQLRVASTLAGDLRRPWHPKLEPGTIASPYRTRTSKRVEEPPKAPRPPHRKTVKPDTSPDTASLNRKLRATGGTAGTGR
jgi:hypothetical protein